VKGTVFAKEEGDVRYDDRMGKRIGVSTRELTLEEATTRCRCGSGGIYLRSSRTFVLSPNFRSEPHACVERIDILALLFHPPAEINHARSEFFK
jgi:hypothetical protein